MIDNPQLCPADLYVLECLAFVVTSGAAVEALHVMGVSTATEGWGDEPTLAGSSPGSPWPPKTII